MFRRELRRNDVDQKLPPGGHTGELEHEVSRILKKILTDQHYRSAQSSEIPCYGQVLVAHALPIDPYAKPCTFCNHFLRTMAKGAGSHGGRRRLYPFFPEKPGLMATSQTWTTS